MKTRIAISSFLILLVLVYFYAQIPAKENKRTSLSGTNPSKFRIGLTNIGCQTDFDFLSPLNCNLWHKYMGDQYIGNKWYPKGWFDIGAPNDLLFNGINSYKDEVQGILNSNKNRNYLSYSDRPKIDMLTYAQRSDYQCEEISVPSTDNGVDWWYAFDNHSCGNDTEDEGRIVRYCQLSTDNAPDNLVVKSVRANREQVNNGSRGFWDGNYSWYIKPMVKVDQDFVNNPDNSEINLFNIKVKNYNGNYIINVDIKAKYFWNENNYYDGNYKEEFRFPNNNLLKIENSGPYPNGNEFNPNNYSSKNHENPPCLMDIEVYWYKECDMWIDYVRADNEWADRLFKDYYDDPQNPDYRWIEWEANQIASTNTTYNFYTDEAEYNMMPAIQYLNEKIHTPYQPNLSVNSIVNITFYSP
ncbi:MAG: hypothetical protein NTU73_10220, partial [Ignavibacteriae bacterium]|nr:hypothetical protein [Ignavibacteriota bacterium]